MDNLNFYFLEETLFQEVEITGASTLCYETFFFFSIWTEK